MNATDTIKLDAANITITPGRSFPVNSHLPCEVSGYEVKVFDHDGSVSVSYKTDLGIRGSYLGKIVIKSDLSAIVERADESVAVPVHSSASGLPRSMDREAVIAKMRAQGRHELVNYAGAMDRDETAWFVCAHYTVEPGLHEYGLLQRAYKSRWGTDVDLETIAATRGTAH